MNVSILVKDGKRCDNIHLGSVPDSNPEHLLNLSALPDGIPDLKNQFYQQVWFVLEMKFLTNISLIKRCNLKVIHQVLKLLEENKQNETISIRI